MFFVPVVNQKQEPLMPTTLLRARRWVSSGKATYFYSKGVHCVRLNQQSKEEIQCITIGIDPGSKREAYTVKSRSHTYLNVLSSTVDWVKDAVESRRNARRARRNRKTPCRQNRKNRARGGIPPSTKARWQLKLRVCNWLSKLFHISHFVVEDVAARTKAGNHRWNSSFSPLEVGKKWFYYSLCDLAPVTTLRGYRTAKLRERLKLSKSTHKLADTFDAHNVDSWVLANWETRGHKKPDNTSFTKIEPIRLHRRQLHMFQPAKKDVRRNYGGTRSLGFTRGSTVRHKKLGVVYVGGASKGRVSLHDVSGGKRLTQNAKTEDIKFLSYGSWRGGNSSPC